MARLEYYKGLNTDLDALYQEIKRELESEKNLPTPIYLYEKI